MKKEIRLVKREYDQYLNFNNLLEPIDKYICCFETTDGLVSIYETTDVYGDLAIVIECNGSYHASWNAHAPENNEEYSKIDPSQWYQQGAGWDFMSDPISLNEYGELHNIALNTIRAWQKRGKMYSYKIGNQWVVPENLALPRDNRYIKNPIHNRRKQVKN